MNGRFGGLAPGVAHFIAPLVVRAGFDAAQQQWQRDAGRNQRQQNHAGGDEYQQIALGKRTGPHEHWHRHHTRQRHSPTHTRHSQ